MPKVPITVMGYRCERCGHEWVPRGGGDDEPRVCAKCKSPYWNTPRTRSVKGKGEASDGDGEQAPAEESE